MNSELDKLKAVVHNLAQLLWPGDRHADALRAFRYRLALAGDEIYADPSSIVGSIGVLMDGFE